MVMTAVVTVIAVVQLIPAMPTARSDSAMRILVDQLRQAREYSIANRRYVAISFPVVAGQSEIVITQMNMLTPGAGGVNPSYPPFPFRPTTFAAPGSKDGLFGTVNDEAMPPDHILQPGPDGKLGTADDVQIPLSNFTRTITIVNVTGNPNLRQIQVTVNYNTAGLQRQYTLTTFISAFNRGMGAAG